LFCAGPGEMCFNARGTSSRPSWPADTFYRGRSGSAKLLPSNKDPPAMGDSAEEFLRFIRNHSAEGLFIGVHGPVEARGRRPWSRTPRRPSRLDVASCEALRNSCSSSGRLVCVALTELRHPTGLPNAVVAVKKTYVSRRRAPAPAFSRRQTKLGRFPGNSHNLT